MTDASGYAPVDGGRLYFDRRGSGNPIVWLHAGFLDRRMWDPQFDRFGGQYDLVRYDQRGYGLSDPPTVDYYESRDLAGLLDHLGIGSAYLVGAGMGARVALDFAVDYPHRADGVVLVVPTVTGFRPEGPEEVALWEQVDQREDEVEARADGPPLAAVATKIDLWAPRIDPATRERLLEIASENRDRVLARSNPHRRAVQPSTFERLPACTAPVLVVTGAEDLPAFHRLAERLAEKLPNAQAIAVPGADHLPSLSTPEAFHHLLEGFFARLDFVAMQRGSTR